MIWEIYSYWNTEIFGNVFQAIALILNNAGYHDLFIMGVTLGTVFALIASMAGKGTPVDILKHILIGALMFWILIVPRTTVTIIDKSYLTQNATPTYVGDIPVSLAFLAHTTTSFGQWIDETFSTFFGAPADLQAAGTHMSRRIMTEMALARPENAITLHNIGEYTRECVVYDLNTGVKNLNDINKSDDTWGALDGTNPAIFVTLTQYDAATGTTTDVIQSCPDAYISLTATLNNAATNSLLEHAETSFPGMTATAAKAAYSSVVTSSMAFFMSNSTLSAEAVFKNAVVQNSFLSEMGELSGNPISLSKAIKGVEEGANQKQELSKSFFFTLTVVQLIAYALFPIVALFVVVSGVNGLKPLLMLVKVLVWLALVQGLQIIIDEIIIMNAAAEARNSIQGVSGGSIDSWLQAGGIINGMEAQLQNALYASLALSWGLVHLGGMSGSSIAQGLFGGAQVYNERTATDLAAEGKNSFGSTDYMNKSAYNSSGFKSDMAVSQNDYGATIQGSDNAKTKFSGQGGSSVDVSDTQNSGTPLTADFGKQVSNRFSQQAEKAKETAVTQKVAAEKARQSAITQTASHIDAADVVSSKGSGMSTQKLRSAESVYQKVDDFAKKWAEKTGVSKKTADEFATQAIMGGSFSSKSSLLGKAAALLAGVEFKAGKEGHTKEAYAREMVNDLTQMQESTSKESIANASRFAHAVAKDDRIMADNKALTSDRKEISGKLEQSAALKESSESLQKRAESFKTASDFVKSQTSSTGIDFLKSMQDTGKYKEMASLAKTDPGKAMAIAQEYVMDKLQEIGQKPTEINDNYIQQQQMYANGVDNANKQYNGDPVKKGTEAFIKAETDVVGASKGQLAKETEVFKTEASEQEKAMEDHRKKGKESVTEQTSNQKMDQKDVPDWIKENLDKKGILLSEVGFDKDKDGNIVAYYQDKTALRPGEGRKEVELFEAKDSDPNHKPPVAGVGSYSYGPSSHSNSGRNGGKS